MKYPISKTHTERLDLAKSAYAKLKNKYGGDLLAFGLHGAAAREDDQDYSGLDMIAAVRGEDIAEYSTGIYQGLKWELDIVSRDTALGDIRQIGLDWPVFIEKYLGARPVLDRQGLFSSFHNEFDRLTEEELSRSLGDIFVADIAREFARFFQAVLAGKKRLIRYGAFRIFERMTGFIGIMNKAFFSSSSRAPLEAMRLPLNFPAFLALGDLVLKGNMKPIDGIHSAVNKLYQELGAFIKDNKLDPNYEKLDF